MASVRFAAYAVYNGAAYISARFSYNVDGIYKVIAGNFSASGNYNNAVNDFRNNSRVGNGVDRRCINYNIILLSGDNVNKRLHIIRRKQFRRVRRNSARADN